MCIFDHPDFLMRNQKVDATTKHVLIQCGIWYVYCSSNYTWPTHLERNTRTFKNSQTSYSEFKKKKENKER